MQNFSALLAASLVAAPAFAWDVRTDSEGDVVRWTKPVTMVLDLSANRKLREDKAEAAVRAAVQALDAATPGLSIALEVGAAGPLGYTVGATDNTNSVIVLEDWPYAAGTLAVTLVTLNARTNELLDADIALNAEEHAFKVLPENESLDAHHFYDVQNTLTHELGHVLGLMHSTSSEDLTMYPSAPPSETTKRHLKQDDLDGLLALYGQASAAPSSPATEGQVPAVGCSSTSNTSSPAFVAVVLAALGFLRTQRRAVRAAKVVAAAAAVVVAVSPAPAQAQVQRPIADQKLELPAALARAEQLSLVEVKARRSMWHPTKKGLIVTELTVGPVECLKGACSPPATVIVAGGRVGDIEQVAMHEPVPEVGARTLAVTNSGRTRLFWPRGDLSQIVRVLREKTESPKPQGVISIPPSTP